MYTYIYIYVSYIPVAHKPGPTVPSFPPTTVHRPLGGHCHGRVASHRISLECSGGLEPQKNRGYLGFLRFLSWMRLRKNTPGVELLLASFDPKRVLPKPSKHL